MSFATTSRIAEKREGAPMSAEIHDAVAAAVAQATGAHAEEELAEAGIVLEDARDFMAEEPPPFDWIITDVIAKRMKGDVNGKSKQNKTFAGMQLVLCASTGRPFLNMSVPRPRRCAYFNLELLKRGFWERLQTMEAALGATPDPGMLYVANLRGNAGELRKHTPGLVAKVKRLGIDLVVLDPRYKLIGEGEDENSAAGLRGVLDFRDALAEVAAVVMIGHDPKGEVAGKSMADRGAGSYTAGADFDFAFALSPHVETGYTVLSTSCRYRKSPRDLTIIFDEETLTFEAEPDKPAVVRDNRRGDGARARSADEKAERTRLRLQGLETAVKEFVGTNPLIDKTNFMLRLASLPAGAAFPQSGTGCLRDAVKSLIERGVIAETREKKRKRNGEIGNVKNGNTLIGAPGKVADYLKQFEVLPL